MEDGALLPTPHGERKEDQAMLRRRVILAIALVVLYVAS